MIRFVDTGSKIKVDAKPSAPRDSAVFELETTEQETLKLETSKPGTRRSTKPSPRKRGKAA